ncbi:TRAP transporter small permease [Pseudogracilibacillus sp. SE30717A]|uniref:TRAP transporter small permease n=1 Tax=Pseudogracilibacillus sp. SE30717A TaxID=3098293 RepID=UPI00300DCCE4
MRWINKIYFVIKYVNITVLFTMFFVLMLQVITRKFLDNPLSWPEEISLITMIWISFFGAYQCTVENVHLKMDILSNKLSEKGKQILKVVSNFFVLGFLIMVVYWAYPFILQSGSLAMPVSGLPMWVPYGIIWISCMLMTIEIIRQIIGGFKQLFSTHSHDGGAQL